MLINAEQVKKYKFKTDFYHEDYVLSLDLLREGCKAVGCKEPLLRWRYIQTSRSFNKAKSAQNRWKIYDEYLHLPLWKSLYVFACYSLAGFKKYFRKAKATER